MTEQINLDALVERLRRTHTQTKVYGIYGGALAYSDGETREVPINPDGPEAAKALTTLSEKNAKLVEALEKARHFLTSTSQESGWCCCGDTVATHGLGSGHSPVDEQQHFAASIVESIDQALGDQPHEG